MDLHLMRSCTKGVVMFENFPTSESITYASEAVSSSELWTYLNPIHYTPEWIANMGPSTLSMNWEMPNVGFESLSNAASPLAPEATMTSAIAALALGGGLYSGFRLYQHRQGQHQSSINDTASQDVDKALNALSVEKVTETKFRGQGVAKDRWQDSEQFSKAKEKFASFLSSDSPEAKQVLQALKQSKSLEESLLQEMNNFDVKQCNRYPLRSRARVSS